jgi:hypothetical protein
MRKRFRNAFDTGPDRILFFKIPAGLKAVSVKVNNGDVNTLKAGYRGNVSLKVRIASGAVGQIFDR